MFIRCTTRKICSWHVHYAISGQRRPRSACAYAQADRGLHCPLTELMDIVVYVDEERMSRPDCTDTHVHLGLCCLHMAHGPFPKLHIIWLWRPYLILVSNSFANVKTLVAKNAPYRAWLQMTKPFLRSHLNELKQFSVLSLSELSVVRQPVRKPVAINFADLNCTYKSNVFLFCFYQIMIMSLHCFCRSCIKA